MAEQLGRDGRHAVFCDRDAFSGAVVAEAEVILCGYPPKIDWSGAVNLKLLHFMGAGIDSLWPAQGLPESVVIANCRGMHAMEMRDHTLGMILAFERQHLRLMEAQRRKHWETFEIGTVAGKTVGLIGVGEVGRPIAAACKALGMRVLGVVTHSRPIAHVDEVYGAEELHHVLRHSDYCVVTVPLTKRTRLMLDIRALACLRPHAVLIGISRGGIVDERALAAALKVGRLRGAALDVFEEEPLPKDSVLWDTPNLVITPHVAGYMPGYVERAVGIFLKNIARYERGEGVATEVGREREY